MIQIGNKNIKGVYLKVGNEKKRLLVKSKINNRIVDFIEYIVQKELNYIFNESASSSRSHTFNIPDLISIDKITVDTGNVNYTIEDNNVKVFVSGGNYVRKNYNSTKYCKSVTDYTTSSSNSFSSSIDYSSNGYSGTLCKSGNSYIYSGSYTSADSKEVTSTYAFNKIGETPSSTQNYNKNGYSGILLIDYNRTNDSIRAAQKYGQAYYTSFYNGTVTRPASDTRIYRQNYSGTVYKGDYDYYYKYEINIKYTIKK